MDETNSLLLTNAPLWQLHGRLRIDYPLVRPAIACLLLLAAGLKIDQLSTQPVMSGGILHSRSLVLALILAEQCLACWLLSNLFESLCRFTTTICFGVFSFASACEVVAGKTSCGCFGKIEVHPAYTLALDLLIFAISFGSCLGLKNAATRIVRRRNIIAAGTIFIIGATAAIVSAVRFTTTAQEDVQDRWTPGALVVLEPDKWIGKPFPLTAHIDIGDRLQSGRWKVVLYHNDCSSCQSAVPRFEQMVRAGLPELNGSQVALIEMPEYAAEGEGLVSSNSPCLHGRLRDDQDWFAQTPVVVDLDAGIVTHATAGDGGNSQ